MGNVLKKFKEKPGDGNEAYNRPQPSDWTQERISAANDFQSIDSSRLLGGMIPMSHLIFGVSSQNTNIVAEYFPRKESIGSTRKPKIDLMNYSGTVLKSESELIVCGGISFDLKVITPAAYVLDLYTREKRDLPPMHDFRYTFPICYYDKKIYAVGGRVFGNDNIHSLLEKCEKFDFRTQQWTRIANLNKKRCTASLAVVNGQIWVFGGYSTGGKRTRKVERYNEIQDVWEIVDFRLAVGVDAFNLIPAKEKDSFFIYGGKLQDNTSRKVIKYNLSTNSYKGFPNSSFDNLISKCFPLSDRNFLIIGEGNASLMGEIFNIDNERVEKNMSFGANTSLSDLKKYNGVGFTVELQFEPRPPIPRWQFRLDNPYPNKSAAEITEIERKYAAKNYMFGTDLRSYIVEIDSQTGDITERGVPNALNLACFQGVERIMPNVVMFCGGVNRPFGKIFDTAFLLNLETYAVEKLPSMPVAKYTFSLKRLNNYVYAMGGRVYGETSQSVISSVERFSLITKTWQSINCLRIPRCTANVLTINDRLFIMGGYTIETKRTNTIEVFSERTEKFQAFGLTLQEPTEAGFAFQKGNLVLYCGGRRHTERSNAKEILDFGGRDRKMSKKMNDTLRNRGYLQKGCVYKDYLFIFSGLESPLRPDIDCVFLKNFENVHLESLFEKEKNELIKFSDSLARVIQKYVDGAEILKHDAFLPAYNPHL